MSGKCRVTFKTYNTYMMVCIIICLVISVVLFIYLLNINKNRKVNIGSRLLKSNSLSNNLIQKLKANPLSSNNENTNSKLDHNQHTSETVHKSKAYVSSNLNYNVHIFYYMWYGNTLFNGEYIHWNHERLPHWSKETAMKWPRHRHVPPDDIASSFYPSLGVYSSHNPTIVEGHMQQIEKAGIGVVAVSWYPKGMSDNNGTPVDELMPTLLDVAQRHAIKVTFHIEPYKGRNASNLHTNIKYLIEAYGGHPAFYRHDDGTKSLPMVYIYDSYITSSKDWRTVFSAGGKDSIRGTAYDALVLGLLVEERHQQDIVGSGFDGFYTYFATNGFTFGSSHARWKPLSEFATRKNVVFVPSVGPGYVDTAVRPWNGVNTRDRAGGAYYEAALRAALDKGVSPRFLSITSFNEWHEGTQIEEAVPRSRTSNSSYLDYSPHSQDHYLKLTKKWITNFHPTKVH